MSGITSITKRKLTAVLSAAAMSAFLSGAAAAGQQDFTVVNATGYTISELYVAPTKSTDWESDILGKDVLADGDSTEIEFSRSEDTCRWDLKVVYEEDNSSVQWAAINLCDISKVTLKYSHKSGETSALTE